MVCGHQHENVCCRKAESGIAQHSLEFVPLEETIGTPPVRIEVARVPLDCPTLLRVGGCHGYAPEFAYTDYSTFTFIRIVPRT
jgi:hypothetical protein